MRQLWRCSSLRIANIRVVFRFSAAWPYCSGTFNTEFDTPNTFRFLKAFIRNSVFLNSVYRLRITFGREKSSQASRKAAIVWVFFWAGRGKNMLSKEKMPACHSTKPFYNTIHSSKKEENIEMQNGDGDGDEWLDQWSGAVWVCGGVSWSISAIRSSKKKNNPKVTTDTPFNHVR